MDIPTEPPLGAITLVFGHMGSDRTISPMATFFNGAAGITFVPGAWPSGSRLCIDQQERYDQIIGLIGEIGMFERVKNTIFNEAVTPARKQ